MFYLNQLNNNRCLLKSKSVFYKCFHFDWNVGSNHSPMNSQLEYYSEFQMKSHERFYGLVFDVRCFRLVLCLHFPL